MRVFVSVFFAFALLLPAQTAQAQGSEHVTRYVAQELPRYVPDVDISTLSQHQISSLYLILQRSDSASTIRGEARSIIYGLGRIFAGGARAFP